MNATIALEAEQAAIGLMIALKSDVNYALATRYLCRAQSIRFRLESFIE
jgi:hypothetical protein